MAGFHFHSRKVGDEWPRYVGFFVFAVKNKLCVRSSLSQRGTVLVPLNELLGTSDKIRHRDGSP